MQNAMLKIVYFFAGVGVVNISLYPRMKEYTVRHEREVTELIAEHKSKFHLDEVNKSAEAQ